MSAFDDLYRRSIDDPEAFWGEAARALHWDAPWERVLDDRHPPFYRWFSGARCNTCFNALDRHVEAGRGDRKALIYDSAVTDGSRAFTYAELLERVRRFAGVLVGLGVGKGDRVVVYMPMVPEAAIAMLACARIGAVHSVVFGGFAAEELAVRIDDAEPDVIVTASAGIEVSRVIPYKPLLDRAIEIAAHTPRHCVILERPHAECELVPGRDLSWLPAEAEATPIECVSVEATDPLYILYTSGTTGRPKGVVRDHGGHMVALHWSMKHVYGVEPEDVFWAASDVGWVVGHSYIVYGPLLHGNTTVLYEGKPVGTPDARAFWRVVEEHGVSVLFTAPTAIRAIKREDPEGHGVEGHDLSSLRALFLAGERADPDTVEWAEHMLGLPVIDHWWQTETGWPIAANCIGIEALPVKRGSPTKAVPGWDIRVLDERGHEVAPGTIGAFYVKLPLPPGSLPTLWRDDERFVSSYLEEVAGYYATSDAGYRDEDGYLWVMARTDDIINVAGHRLSTGGMEEVLAAHPDVAECAVIGVADALKGEVPVGLVVLKAGVTHPAAEIEAQAVAMVRERIGAVASLKTVLVVDRLPKTRSGKVLRGTMKKIADGETYKMPATIEEPVVLDEIKDALSGRGLAGER